MSDDGYFLPRHEWEPLRRTLARVPALAEDLAITLTRQDRVQKPGLSKSSRRRPESALPMHLGAAEASAELHSCLAGWVRLVVESRGIDYMPIGFTHREGFVGPLREDEARVPIGYDAGALPVLTRWLRTNLVALAMTEGSSEAADDIASQVDNVRRVIDLPQYLNYQGQCGSCGGDLRALREDRQITCQCGLVIQKSDNDRKINNILEARLFTATELVGIVFDRFGVEIKPKTVHDMAYRKVNPMTVRGVGYDGQKLYRAGDVFDALRQRKAIA